MNPSCQHCVYWVGYDDKNGTCHRYPPQVVVYVGTRPDGPINSDLGVEFPITGRETWCGEWQLKVVP